MARDVLNGVQRHAAEQHEMVGLDAPRCLQKSLYMSTVLSQLASHA